MVVECCEENEQLVGALVLVVPERSAPKRDDPLYSSAVMVGARVRVVRRTPTGARRSGRNVTVRWRNVSVIVTDVVVAPDFADGAFAICPIWPHSAENSAAPNPRVEPPRQNPSRKTVPGQKKRNPDAPLTRFFFFSVGSPSPPSLLLPSSTKLPTPRRRNSRFAARIVCVVCVRVSSQTSRNRSCLGQARSLFLSSILSSCPI
jgi:hypothetical protein